MKLIITIILIILLNPAYSRSIFVNGIDVSSIKNQTLKKVDVYVDEHGNIYIQAPHYQVTEESSFIPLSKYYQNHKPNIEHKPIRPLTTNKNNNTGAVPKSDNNQILNILPQPTTPFNNANQQNLDSSNAKITSDNKSYNPNLEPKEGQKF